MRTRILPRDEWHRLPDTGLLSVLWRTPDATVHVAEDGGKIVGCLAELKVTHLEGLWVDPAYRVSAGRALLRLAREIVFRCRWTLSGVTSDCMRRVMNRLGAKREADMFVLSAR